MARLPRPVVIIALGLVSARLLLAQEIPGGSSRPAADTADVLVLDHDFTGGGEFVRVYLENRQVYRAELSTADLTLLVRAVPPKTRAPRVYQLLGSGPSGSSVAEIYPDVDGEYEIRPLAMPPGGVNTRLRLYRDVASSQRRLAVLKGRQWDVGVEIAAGWHSGFARANGAPSLITSEPHAGSDIEACFSARSAPGTARMQICAVGIGYQSQVGASSIAWFFTEPRFGVLGRARPGQSNWELGGLIRLGVGAMSRTAAVPMVLAPGAYLARQIRTNREGSGWSVQASYSHNLYRGFPTGFGSRAKANPQSDRLTLGFGWYQ